MTAKKWKKGAGESTDVWENDMTACKSRHHKYSLKSFVAPAPLRIKRACNAGKGKGDTFP